MLFQKGLYHQVEFHILLALVYAVGICAPAPVPGDLLVLRLRARAARRLSTEDWSRYFLSMAPFALIVGYRDLIDTRFFRWVVPVFAALSVYYAWGVIPLNGCRPDIYLRLLAHLGLLPEAARRRPSAGETSAAAARSSAAAWSATPRAKRPAVLAISTRWRPAGTGDGEVARVGHEDRRGAPVERAPSRPERTCARR